jgi:hypothetical protein
MRCGPRMRIALIAETDQAVRVPVTPVLFLAQSRPGLERAPFLLEEICSSNRTAADCLIFIRCTSQCSDSTGKAAPKIFSRAVVPSNKES